MMIFPVQILGKARKSLVRGRVKAIGSGFPTKLSTDFVDKNIALLLQWLSVDFNTSREDVKPSAE
jgi:hypothetical protein